MVAWMGVSTIFGSTHPPIPLGDILPGLCSRSTPSFIHRTMGPIEGVHGILRPLVTLFTSKHKALWKENLIVKQMSLTV